MKETRNKGFMRRMKSYTSAAIILTIFLSFGGCNSKEVSLTLTETDISNTGVTTTPEIETTTTDSALLLDNALEYIIQNTSYKKKFLKWISSTYNQDVIFSIERALKEASYDEELWHILTGKTITLLKDQYKGNLDSVEKAAANNIYFKDVSKEGEIVLGFAGDVCLSEGWPTLLHYDKHQQDITKCVSENLLTSINAVDLMMLNNEFTFSTRGTALEGKAYTFKAQPERVEILSKFGVDIVSLANNHCYDYGADAFFDTMSTLNDAGIPYVGGGKNMDEAKKPVYYIVDGRKIAYVSATRAEKYLFTPEAGKDSPGVLRTYEPELFIEVIKKAAKNSDYVIAYVHWGTEFSDQAEDYQREFGKDFIDAGADAVIGGHPHVLQGIEYYKNKPIVYSLANFWFNEKNRDTGVINLTIGADGLDSMTFLPCTQLDCFTNLETETSERRRIFDYMESISFGITIDDDGVIHQTNTE